MKILSIIFLVSMCILSCTRKNADTKKETQNTITGEPIENSGFFPVTSYIKGEISSIKRDGINPLVVTTIHGKSDSSWLRVEDFSTAFSSFLTPVIDTANFKEFYKETSFLDQGMNTYTFLYEPSKQLPDSFFLRRWDVYIDPENNKVKRIFIEKKWSDTLQQLTWQSGKWAKIITIVTKNNIETIEQETNIHWNFNE